MDIEIKELYEKYGPMVLRRCNYLLKDEDAAFDAAQEVFLKIIEKKDRLKIKYPSSLLYTIATNICLNIIRDGKKHSKQNAEDIINIIACEEDHSDRFLINDLLDHLFDRELPGTREIAVMHFIDKMTYEQISAEVNLSVSGIRKRLRKLSENAKIHLEGIQ